MPTIKDVAKKAGVTVTTVSRVLNNRGYISDKTRELVYRVMEEINYHPNEIARSLLRQKSNIIGLIIPSVAHPFFGELSSHLEYYAYEQGYKILLCDSNFDLNKEKDYVEMLRQRQVDGLIMGSHSLEISAFLQDELPIVSFDRRIADHIPYVASDNLNGGRLAAEHLAKKGCKKVLHLCGNLSLKLLANLRNKGFIIEANKSGMEVVTIETEVDVFNPLKAQITQLFSDHTDLDGIFAGSDLQAAYIIQECYSRGIRIPQDLKLVGYDDVELASLLIPQLTSIHQPIEEMANLAFQLVKQQIEGEDFTVENILDVTLIERDST